MDLSLAEPGTSTASPRPSSRTPPTRTRPRARAEDARDPAAVALGHKGSPSLSVAVEQVEDVDGTAASTEPRIYLWPPPGWSEDYAALRAGRRD